MSVVFVAVTVKPNAKYIKKKKGKMNKKKRRRRRIRKIDP